MYIKEILNHNKNPMNFKTLEKFTIKTEKNNSLCGDRVCLYIKINENDIIEDIGFQGEGCAITMASSSMITEYLKGKHKRFLNEVSVFDYLDEEYCNNLNSRFKCANLPIEALKEYLEN